MKSVSSAACSPSRNAFIQIEVDTKKDECYDELITPVRRSKGAYTVMQAGGSKAKGRELDGTEAC